jgi:glycosyltransferase involved in cell wall biosynthesis
MFDTIIILTSYNYGNYISAAIGSIINQTYRDWKLLIIDDGSNDDSIEIIRKYIDSSKGKIQLITHPDNQNHGIAETYRLALENIDSEYIAFLESDDYWEKDLLEKKISILKKEPDVSLVYSDLNPITDENILPQRLTDYIEYSRFVGGRKSNPFNILNIIAERNPVVSFSNIVIRSKAIRNFKIIKEFETWTDWQLVIESALTGKFYYINEKLFNWRIHSSSTNSKFLSEINIDSLKKKFKSEIINKYKESEIIYNDYDNYFKFINNISGIKNITNDFLHKLNYFLHYPSSGIRELKRILHNL